MRRFYALAVLLTLSISAIAADTFRFNGGVVTTGDSIAALVKRAGQPSRIVQLENSYGAAVGERWEYYLPGGKFVSFEITGGKIVSINEVR